ncbi:uncharacterized protein si:ch211-214p13.8 [Triplophysa rosa]|uniref:Ig-like domain-containing protein n=1 Tax=Triplophysa rosa TaxID=992332 RepID=A0A9W7WU51_TRIRA|nr:uncharacterized protein si:ch211-214p13.8 [Triplophysa rosa]KAI7808403.1 hypothetical protein IRJ41_004041 [Triplophysa rosa]
MDWLYLKNTEAFLTLFMAFILHVSIDAQGQGQGRQCPVFKVTRGTVHKVCLKKSLKISCSLKYCDDQPINIILWTKSDYLGKWIPVNTRHHISSSQKHFDLLNLTSYLTFTNISKHHEGSYRCEFNLPHISTVSHQINVFVTDNSTGTEISCTESSDSGPWWLPYLSICMGVVMLIFLTTVITFLSASGFKCSRKKVNQRAQNSEETLQHNHELLTLPCEQSTVYESDAVCDSLSNTKDNQPRQVVYASLKDFTPKKSSTTSCSRTSEEFTIYASIRVS